MNNSLTPVQRPSPVDVFVPPPADIAWTRRNPDGTWTDYLAPAPTANWPTFQPPATPGENITHADYIDPRTGLLTTVPPSATTAAPDLNASHFLDLLGNLFLPTASIQPGTSPVLGGSGGGGGGATGGTAPSALELIRPFLPLVMLLAAGYLIFSFFRK